MISSWVAAFDQVCDNAEEEGALQNISAMRKTAQGILLELEGSRHHYHQRISKNNWDRAIDSALQNSIRQLKEADGKADGQDADPLIKEVELLKANANRDALLAVAEDERAGDAATVQVLLQTHFETIAAIHNIMSMSEEDAVDVARNILRKVLTSCNTVTSHVIKPDGSLMPTEAFPPTRAGTPKRKKQIGLSPFKPMLPPPLAAVSNSSGSPVRQSPKRRKAATAKKGVSFTPKKKSPGKLLKRGVRWRDDTEEGTLAEFEKTPQRTELTPELSSTEPPSLMAPSATTTHQIDQTIDGSDLTESSPIPATSLERKPKHNRFKAGFLAKKTDGSPLPPTLTQFSSDSDQSPLRELEPGKASNRSSSLSHVHNVNSNSVTNENGSSSGSDREESWKANKKDAMQIKAAVKRRSSVAPSSTNPLHRQQRRKSPTGASSGSPPNDNTMFTASHARRMVKSEKENDWKASILSPRTAPVIKHTGPRRTTMGETRPRESGITSREGVRLSTTVTGSGGHARGSLLVGGKSNWR